MIAATLLACAVNVHPLTMDTVDGCLNPRKSGDGSKIVPKIGGADVAP